MGVLLCMEAGVFSAHSHSKKLRRVTVMLRRTKGVPVTCLEVSISFQQILFSPALCFMNHKSAAYCNASSDDNRDV